MMMTIMTMHHPILSLIAGVLILIMPRLLNYIVAIYLMVIGILVLIRWTDHGVFSCPEKNGCYN